MIVVREIQQGLAAEAQLERAPRRLQRLALEDEKAGKARTFVPNFEKGKRDETNIHEIEVFQVGFNDYDAMFWSNYV